MITVDEASFFAVILTAALAAVTVVVVPKRLAPPVVVVELIFGIVIGPQVLGLAEPDEFIDFFSNLGLGMLFFFAGYEIDFERIKGKPLSLGAWGWLVSLVLAYGIGGALAAAGVVLSFLYTGSALATTAIGTLIPILRDGGELRTRFGTYLLAAGAIGEFGPILLITLVLSTTQPLHEALVLAGFIVLALVLALASVRLAWRGFGALERTLESSSQLAVRIATVLVFGLVLLASELGLDLLLGGFVAGMIVRAALRGREVEVFESKLTAVGFGFLIPFFFVESGINFNLDALGSAEAIAKLFLFLGLFLVVRGTPALLLYRGVLAARDRAALAFFSATELPLVVAITTLAIENGEMKSSTAAGLVGAAMLSTLIFPFVGMALRRGRPGDEREPARTRAQSWSRGARRARLISERRRLAASRRSREAAVALVARRRFRGRSAASIRVPQPLDRELAVASLAARVLGDCGDPGPNRARRRRFCSASRLREESISNTASIRDAVTFACCPPGPDERDARNWISLSGTSGATRPIWHRARPDGAARTAASSGSGRACTGPRPGRRCRRPGRGGAR